MTLLTARDLLAANVLRAHYQPIVQLKDGAVVAHESLIRPPAQSALRTPDELFRAARAEGITVQLEQFCVDEGIRSWVRNAHDKRLFLNLSAFAIIEMVDRLSVPGVMRALKAASMAPSALVIEITEHEHVSDLPRLIDAASALRAEGLRFALDDFGDGRSSLRLWAELRPEIDLNDFKPFNDLYGYWRGDEMIRLVARTMAAHCDPRRDFIGHVGGDDFVVLFQSDDWLNRCERIVETFNEKARGLFDQEALERGGIEAEDRHGVMRFFGCTKLSIGAVPVRPGVFSRAEQVASAAAAAKHKAKVSSLGIAIESV